MPLLKYMLLKIGKYNLITSSLIVSVKNIIKHSVLAQVTVNNSKLVELFKNEAMKPFYK